MHLTPEQVVSLQESYRDLINYEDDDPSAAIDPATYRAPDGDRLIHIAAFRGDAETVELLLAAGEDIDAIGDMGDTPAHYAAMGEHRQLFDLLLSRGADQSIENEFGIPVSSAWSGHRADGNENGKADGFPWPRIAFALSLIVAAIVASYYSTLLSMLLGVMGVTLFLPPREK